MQRGKFIVLEGLDGAGTTTQTDALAQWLRERGQRVLTTREPTDGPIGRTIRATLQGRTEEGPVVEAFPWAFAADRADHLLRKVEPALAQGTWVISDRYVPSSLAYQSLTHPWEVIFGLNEHFRVPDALIYVQVDVQTCLQRMATRGSAEELYENEAKLRPIHQAYEDVMERLAGMGQPVHVVDGRPSVEQVGASLRRIIGELL